MSKIIEIIYPNGDVYALPLDFVAKDRANYYVETDSDTTFQEEYDYVMKDDFEGIDWLKNNLDYDEIKNHLALIRSDQDTDMSDFCNFDMEIKEQPND